MTGLCPGYILVMVTAKRVPSTAADSDFALDLVEIIAAPDDLAATVSTVRRLAAGSSKANAPKNVSWFKQHGDWPLIYGAYPPGEPP